MWVVRRMRRMRDMRGGRYGCLKVHGGNEGRSED